MAKAQLRKCSIEGCNKDIPVWLHFCKPHYHQIPKPLKDALSDEWQYMKRSGARHTDRQLELVRQAIDAVTAKGTKKAEKRRAQGGDLTQPQPQT